MSSHSAHPSPNAPDDGASGAVAVSSRSSAAEVRRLSASPLWLALTAVQTGVVAGLIALGYILLDGIVRGDGPWIFLNLLGGVLYPKRAFSQFFGQVTVAGFAVHVVATGISGLVFALLMLRFLHRPIRGMWIGSLAGLVWYYISFRYFWLAVHPAVVLYQPFPATILGHMVFGFCMGLYPKFVEGLGRMNSRKPDAPFA